MRRHVALLALLALAGCDKSKAPAAPPATGSNAQPAQAMPSFKPPEPAAAATPPPAPAAEPAAAPAAEPAAAPAADTWVTWVHPDKLISVRFPGKPEQSENEAPSAIGPVKFTMAMHTSQTRAFMAGATVYKVPAGTPFDVKKALDGGRDQMLSNMKATATGEKDVQQDGFDGREINFEVPGPEGKKIVGVARVFASAEPPAGYFAGAFRMTEAEDPDFGKFLDSIHLGKAVAATP